MTRQYSPLWFETTYSGALYNATTKYMCKISETDVAVAWSNGLISSHRTTYLEDTLKQGFYFDNQSTGLTEGSLKCLFLGADHTSPAVFLSLAVYHDYLIVLCSIDGTLRLFAVNKHKYSTFNVIAPTTVGAAPIEIPLPAGLIVGSSISTAAGKLWIVSQELNSDDTNKLYTSDGNGTWTSVSIPGRKQTEMREIIDDFDGNIIVTSKNDHSVVVFNSAGAYVKTIKVNRHVYGLSRTENKVLYVLSDKQTETLVSTPPVNPPETDITSVLSTINITTGTAAPVGTAAGCNNVIDDLRTGYRWCVGGNPMVRLNIATQAGDEFDGTSSYIQGVMTNQFTYEHYDPLTGITTSSTVRPFLFLRTSTAVYAYRLTSLKGVNSYEALGTAMIAIGPQAYIGD